MIGLSLEKEISYCLEENNWDKLFYLIKKYNLYYTYKIKSKNLLQLLVIYENSNNGIDQFRKHFSKKELIYMMDNIDKDGYSVYHSAAFNGGNMDILDFLICLKRYGDMDREKMVNFEPDYFANFYGFEDWIKKFQSEAI